MTRWFYPDPNQPYTSAADDDKAASLQRRINAVFGLPQGRTMRIGEWRSSTAGKCLEFTDAQYTLLTGKPTNPLTAAEQASVVAVAPAGLVESTFRPRNEVQGWVNRVYVCIGDSIFKGGFVAHAADERLHSLLLDTTSPLIVYGNEDSSTPTEQGLNCGVDSSCYNDTGAPLEDWVQIYSWMVGDLTFGPLTTPVFVVGLGSNDINGEGRTGAQTWALAETFIDQLRTDFPACKIVMCTVIARTTNSTLNNTIIDYNTLLKANYSSAGADAVADLAANTECDPSTPSVTSNSTYYAADGVHPKPALTAIMAATIKTAIAGL